MISSTSASTILHNGKVKTSSGFSTAIAIAGNKIVAVGEDKDMEPLKAANTCVIDLKGRTVIPGLNDSHLHLIRGGLNYNLELRWDGVKSLADALNMLKAQVAVTPAPQWVRVVGGWCEYQFKEKRLPTLDEINAIAPETPVFLLHLYDRALLNRAALKACGFDRNTPEPPGGEIQRDGGGNPTGLLIAKPNAMILYATLSKGPKLAFNDQCNSTRHFMRELNRLAVTSVIDAGGGYQNYPDDYAVINELHKNNQMTVRIAYNLFTQRPKAEKQDFEKWIESTKIGAGDRFLRLNGAGEMLVYSAADFEDFREPRTELALGMQSELSDVVETLVKARWPFRLHATYNETIDKALDAFEVVNEKIPFDNLRWFFDHAETISDKNIERVQSLGGGIAVQHRMAFQGEYFQARYGKDSTRTTPPINKMLAVNLPVGGGTDATRVASFNPFVALKWLVTGETVGGTKLYDADNLLEREEALKLFTEGSAWFSNEESLKGKLETGYLADLAVLSKDYFTIADNEIDNLTSILTIVDGNIVYASDEFRQYAPPNLPVSPSWSPVNHSSISAARSEASDANNKEHLHQMHRENYCQHSILSELKTMLRPNQWFGNDCDCFAF
ncbi:MAG: amidohydrolase [Candidatus Obscuribacterales bacterium]|nr:amidohydrolase [Candidatus Obscuribacterales bacterium]